VQRFNISHSNVAEGTQNCSLRIRKDSLISSETVILGEKNV